MKNIIIKNCCFCLLLISTYSFGQTNLYENPEFISIAKTHKTIGILPFKTSIQLRPKQMKEITPEALQELEKKEGLSVQNGMYSWFLIRKKRGDLVVDIQDPNRTAALLLKNNIMTHNMYEYTMEEIAKILGVDAVISGTFETDKPMSEGASVALGVLFGFWGSTNTAVINISIHNAYDGVLLWNYNKKVSGSIGSSTDDLINTLMRKTSRRLAYTKNEM